LKKYQIHSAAQHLAKGTRDKTDTYPAWVCQISPSRLHRSLIVSLGFASVFAIAISPLLIPIQLALALLTASWVFYQYRRLNRCTTLEHFGGLDDDINDWVIRDSHEAGRDATLIKDGYHSAALLVLAFRRGDNGRIHRLTVWRDSVSDLQFSYLTMQLLFNCDTSEPSGSGVG